MGAVIVPSSASQTPFGADARLSARRSTALRRPFLCLAFRADWTAKCSAAAMPSEAVKPPQKPSKPVQAASVDAAPTATRDLDYNKVAAALESIYKLSPAEVFDVEEIDQRERRRRGRSRKREKEGDGEEGNVVRNRRRRVRRSSLEERIALRRRKDEEVEAVAARDERRDLDEDVEKLLREYSVSTDLASLDWKKMKIPPVLSSAEHNWLFELMQPMKAIFEGKKNLNKDLNREPTDAELAAAVNMTVPQLRRLLEVGRAARNRLIKHNLRLVLFVINKYYPDIASGQKFQDLCQAGVMGLITAIDRFEPKRGFRLSTYGLFWIRHSIIRSMTVSSFTRVPFGIESVRQEIQKAKLELQFELGRLPKDEEIIDRVKISPERFHDVMKATKPIFSLHARHAVTQEEFINGITDVDGVGGDKRRQRALLRLALDDVYSKFRRFLEALERNFDCRSSSLSLITDVYIELANHTNPFEIVSALYHSPSTQTSIVLKLDSLKPKESLVIRQRYGLDGKGDRTLGEIAGNLNISREMVRKHELKAFMKLKHPARVDYLCRYV